MRIGVQTWGSEGDIRPLLALAAGLRSAGHEVTLAVTSTENRDFSALCREWDIRYLKVPEEINCDIRDLGKIIRNSPSRVKALKRLVREIYLEYIDDMYAAARTLCESNDLVIGHFTVIALRLAAVEKKTPFVCVVLFRGCVPSLYLPPGRLPNLGPVGNYLEWRLVQKIVDYFMKGDVNRFWMKSGLRPLRHVLPHAWESDRLNLIAASSVFAPPQRDWESLYRVCGYFYVPEKTQQWEIPSGLQEFLEEGEPPVYMTFGLLQPLYPEKNVELMLEAAHLANCRAIIQTAAPEHPPDSRLDTVYFIDQASHHRIFPHCSAVVYHGGGGTAHSVTLCGRPSVVVGFSNEHMAYGQDLYRLGAGSKPVRFRRVTAETLAGRIRHVLDSPQMLKRASELGDLMRKEDGVGCAVDAVEKLAIR